MKSIKYIIVVTIVVLTVLVLLQPFEFRDTSISFNSGSYAKSLTEKLGTPISATDMSEIIVNGPDGPMPEIAVRSFKIERNEEAVKKFYNDKCNEAGLTKPDDELLHLEPTAICTGRTKEGHFTVLLFLRCEETSCFARVEVRHLI